MSAKSVLGGLLALMALFTTCIAAAEQVYISDTLRVGVRPEPDNRTVPVAVVLSGARLDVLERTEGYLKVRTEKGVTGWIREAYVTTEPPASLRLEAERERRAELERELAEARETARVLEEANRRLLDRADALAAERSRLIREQARLQATIEPRSFSTAWMWWLLGVAVVAAAGFFTGITWYRASVMRRLGGLRV